MQDDGLTALQRSSFLPWTAEAILSSVNQFQMLTTSQIRRLHYRGGTSKSNSVRCSRHLKRLTELGLIRRIKGVYDRAPEYMYLPANSKARRPDMHTLDIAELYVRLSTRSQIIYDCEPWCHVQVGHMLLKPDGYIDTGSMRYWVEMDEATQARAVISQKMNRYINAFERWEEQTFPQVVFITHNADRVRFIHTLAQRTREPALFNVVLFSEVTKKLLD